MQIPPPSDEAQRLDYLHNNNLLDTPPDDVLNKLVQLAASRFSAPISTISLIDRHRQWFKAKCGLDACETGRDVSFCSHAILKEDVMVVADASADRRFKDNPLVQGEPNIRFYAGAPIITESGIKLGTLCVIDSEPRHDFNAQQLAELADLAAVVAHIIDLRVAVNS